MPKNCPETNKEELKAILSGECPGFWYFKIPLKVDSLELIKSWLCEKCKKCSYCHIKTNWKKALNDVKSIWYHVYQLNKEDIEYDFVINLKDQSQYLPSISLTRKLKS